MSVPADSFEQPHLHHVQPVEVPDTRPERRIYFISAVADTTINIDMVDLPSLENDIARLDLLSHLRQHGSVTCNINLVDIMRSGAADLKLDAQQMQRLADTLQHLHFRFPESAEIHSALHRVTADRDRDGTSSVEPSQVSAVPSTIQPAALSSPTAKTSVATTSAKPSFKPVLSRSDEPLFVHNMRMLTEADVVVALVGPSASVGYQIGVAQCLGKPVLCLCRGYFEGRRGQTGGASSGTAASTSSGVISGSSSVVGAESGPGGSVSMAAASSSGLSSSLHSPVHLSAMICGNRYLDVRGFDTLTEAKAQIDEYFTDLAEAMMAADAATRVQPQPQVQPPTPLNATSGPRACPDQTGAIPSSVAASTSAPVVTATSASAALLSQSTA